MKNALHRNGLSLCLLALFLVCQVGLSVAGWLHTNDERGDHAQAPLAYNEYLVSSDFMEATMENWESEFLQMGAYVFLTVFLFQKGSSESKSPDEPDDVDADPRAQPITKDTPWPVRRGGWVLRLYENSLTLAFLGLFAISFVLHAISGAAVYSEEQVLHGGSSVTAWEYLLSSQFWFESLQNWQSEFFSIALMVLLTVFLRQRGSPESKPVAMPHGENP